MLSLLLSSSRRVVYVYRNSCWTDVCLLKEELQAPKPVMEHIRPITRYFMYKLDILAKLVYRYASAKIRLYVS